MARVVLTKRRVLRAVSARLSRVALGIANVLVSEKHLKCNACGEATVGFWTFEGRPFGCPACKSSSRERFVLEEIKHGRLSIPADSRILHVAPSERSIYRLFRRQASECICVDIDPAAYSEIPVSRLDLTTLESRDDLGVFDVIYASHVLEHVRDLNAVLDGMRAKLTERGQAWFLFPMGQGPTVEDPDLTDPREREIRFGQWDHVRLFGDDARALIERRGFDVSILEAGVLPATRVDCLGLDPNDKIFVCRPREIS